MRYRNKAHIDRILEVVGLLIALFGLQRVIMAESSARSGLMALIILVIGAGMGIFGFIAARYNVARDDNDNTSQRLALETLAKLGRRQVREQSKTDPKK